MVRRNVWHRVKAPISWRPKVNEELIGEFLGTKLRSGEFGEYKVHIVKSGNTMLTISGTVVDALFALLAIGIKVKLCYLGKRRCRDSEREYKDYALYTEQVVEFKIAETA